MSTRAYLQIQPPKWADDASFNASEDYDLLENLLDLDSSIDQRGDGGGGLVEFDKQEVREYLATATNVREEVKQAVLADCDRLPDDVLTYELY